jgi:hypothetical protein
MRYLYASTQTDRATMQFNKLILGACALLLIPGVAFAFKPNEENARRNAILQDVNANPPLCSGEADCKVKWEAAQLFVLDNATLKIQISNESLIQTYGSVAGDSAVEMTVTKRPKGGGVYLLDLEVRCGTSRAASCDKDPWSLLTPFRDTINAAKP